MLGIPLFLSAKLLLTKSNLATAFPRCVLSSVLARLFKTVGSKLTMRRTRQCAPTLFHKYKRSGTTSGISAGVEGLSVITPFSWMEHVGLLPKGTYDVSESMPPDFAS